MSKKGYWIAHVDVNDAEAYKDYAAANAIPFRKYNARFLIRGGPFEAKEGAARTRHVVIEFSSYADALACYNSPEYRHAMTFRQGKADADILVIEGYDGPQPTD